MSTAHRPTWTPAQGKVSSLNTRQYSSRDMAAHTKLKFRQPGQGTSSEVGRRDLKLELEKAERKHKLGADETADEAEDEQAAKRRKLLEEAKDLDKDDDEHPAAKAITPAANGDTALDANDDDDLDEDSDDDDSEDETAELLRELEKIKRERAEEKERQEREQASADATDREAQIAMGNPLLNLQAALDGNRTPSASSNASSGFAVKRRWDDDVIFKNQAVSEKPRKEFVNDLLRTEFHKRFLKRFIA